MRDSKRNVLAARRRHNESVKWQASWVEAKPVAPPDLWHRLDALRPKEAVRPENSFTVTEYQKKFNLTEKKARNQVLKMIAEGKLVKQGVYYLIP